MDRAASIFLRSEIYPQDCRNLIRWIENEHVTRYCVSYLLRHEFSRIQMTKIGTYDKIIKMQCQKLNLTPGRDDLNGT